MHARKLRNPSEVSRPPMLLFSSRPTGLGLDRYSRCVNRPVKNLSVALISKDELIAGTINMSEIRINLSNSLSGIFPAVASIMMKGADSYLYL